MTDKDKSPGTDPSDSGQGDAAADPKKAEGSQAEVEFLDGSDLPPLPEEEEAPEASSQPSQGFEPKGPPPAPPASAPSMATAPAGAPAEAAVAQKYCIVCHSLIPASSRVCPVCSTKLALYEGTAHKQFWKFLVGFFLIALGCFLPWSEGYPDAGYQHLVGVFVLLAAIAGMWKMWVGLVSNRFSLAPIGWGFLIFFWALYQVLMLGNSFQMLERPDSKVALQDPRVRDLRASELRELIRTASLPEVETPESAVPEEGGEEGTTPMDGQASEPQKKKELPKGMGALFQSISGSISEAFGEEGRNLYSLRRNVSRWGMGKLIVFLGSSYIIWVFFASMLGIKKGSKDSGSGGGGGAAAKRSARSTGSSSRTSTGDDKAGRASKDDKKGRTATTSARTSRRSGRSGEGKDDAEKSEGEEGGEKK